MYEGGCLCGAVRFEIAGPIRNIVYCHCSRCRKAQGSAFATNGIVAASEFEITKGEDELTVYESMPGKTGAYLTIPHGREAGIAGWATRSEERGVV